MMGTGYWYQLSPEEYVFAGNTSLIYLNCHYAPISGLRGAEEVDEAEDYEAPGSNPGQEL
jgi:hypothetical protein